MCTDYLQGHPAIQAYDNQTNLKLPKKTICRQSYVHGVKQRVSPPLLNSSLVPVLSHIVLSENNK